VRQAQIEHQKVHLREVGPDVREQLSGALEGDGPVTGPDERRREPVSDKCGIVGNYDRFAAHALDCRIYQVLAIIRTSIVIARSVYGHLSGM
jgi:hypothetical protein